MPFTSSQMEVISPLPVTEHHLLLSARRSLSQNLLLTLRGGHTSRATTSAAPPRRRLGVLLRVDFLDDLLDLLRLQVGDLVAGRHDGDFDVFGARLHDLEQRFDGQLDGAVAVERVGVVALEEFAHRLAGAADGICFPGLGG